jgi:uncharacterized membrane protein
MTFSPFNRIIRRLGLTVADLWIVVICITLFAWAQSRTLQATTLSDDAALFFAFTQASERGDLLAETFGKFRAPLAVGGTVWRPFAWVTYGLDAFVWGFDAPMWRLTNLVLYFATALVLAMLIKRLRMSSRAACVGGALWLLLPWSAETTVWIAGRFDLLATLGLVYSLWAVLGSKGMDRSLLLGVIAFALALMSKESAISFPPFIGLALIMRPSAINKPLRERLYGAVRDFAPFVLVFFVYLLWRWHLFGSNMIGIYEDTSALLQQDWSRWIVSAINHLSFPATLMGSLAWSSVTALVCAVLCMCLVAMRIKNSESIQRVVALGLFILLVSMLAIGFHFREPLVSGDGLRLYMVASIGVILICAVSAERPAGWVLSVALIVSCASMQREINARWWYASDAALQLSAEARRIAMSTSDADYVLIVAPDRLDIVPFVRNAQGAMLLPPMQPRSLITHVILATNLQLSEWHKILDDEVVPKITSRPNAPKRPTRYACFNTTKRRIVELGFWERPESNEAWLSIWRQQTGIACPDISRTIR